MGKIDSKTAASFALVLGGALWGIIWIPLRELERLGLDGVWPGFVLYFGAAVFLLPVAVVRWRSILNRFSSLALCGLLTGTAFCLYSTSVLLTEVVRALLLFYLTPIWGTLLGLVFLSERLTPSRLLALGLAFCGLLVILGIGNQFPWPRNIGDVLALGSGIFWAAGSLALYRGKENHPIDTGLSFIFGALLVTSMFIFFGGSIFGEPRPMHDLAPFAKFLPLAAIYIVPMILLTIWPAMLLTPGRVGILLMSDVVVGVISAAVLTGEPFGWRELTGAILVISAAIVEVLGGRRMD